MTPPVDARNPDFPFTLDLRRVPSIARGTAASTPAASAVHGT
jgi:hypothetical protein